MSGLMTATERLGKRSALRVVGMFDAWQDDELDEDTFTTAAPLVIATANRQGMALATLSLNGALVAAGHAPVAAADTVEHYLNPERLALAVATALEVMDTARDRLERLATAEPIEATQRTFGALMRNSDAVEGWTREVESDACEWCESMAGPTLPTSVQMATHTACVCTQSPAIRGR